MRENRSEDVLEPSNAVVRSLCEAARLSGQAVVVGNRAGIVEWANTAWTRITGYPRSETISKPISHFLEQTSIDLALVDFVAQNFLDGSPCTIEFPFDTFDEREIWIHLEVQPIRNAENDISDFVAVATDVTARHLRESAVPAPEREQDPIQEAATGSPPLPRAACENVSLSDEAKAACERLVRNAHDGFDLDLDLAPELPTVESNRIVLSEVMRLLLNAARVDTATHAGYITVMTGRTRAGRSHVSAAHPITARPGCLAKAEFLYFEVHDTAPILSQEALDAIEQGIRSENPRTDSLVIASALANLLGARLHLDSTPGCGTQSLLLLPLGPKPDTR